MKTISTEYATIGSRIEEYATIAIESGWKAAKAEIAKTYNEESAFVIEGLRICLKYGIDTYYTGIIYN